MHTLRSGQPGLGRVLEALAAPDLKGETYTEFAKDFESESADLWSWDRMLLQRQRATSPNPLQGLINTHLVMGGLLHNGPHHPNIAWLPLGSESSSPDT